MNAIEKLDPNFKVKTNIEKDNIRFYDAQSDPFKIYGVFMEDGLFRRMPEKVAETVSEGVRGLHYDTAGGRIRFKTNSPYVAINAKLLEPHPMQHFAYTGIAGFDLYESTEYGDKYIKTFIPPIEINKGYESVIDLDGSTMRSFTINMPLYSGVKEIYIGLDEKADIAAPDPYRDISPIVYYGSSITQGGCASRPGNTYEAMLTRRFNVDHINLGFSGNAKGELEMENYIKSLDMSVFVYDYDFNAPSSEHLASTHERMFKGIRAAHPSTPIIIMSRPKYELNAMEQERRDIVYQTYENAVKNGDKNVYFIGGEKLMQLCRHDGTVDGVHPTDLGFKSMAEAVGEVLEKIF